MYSTQPPKENKAPVVLTYQGEVLATHRMTRKEVDKFVAAMLEKGYELEVIYNGKC
jgi:hypothetical protein